MPYTPKFKAVFEDKVIDNVLAVIKRDFKFALDYYYPTEAALLSTNPAFLKDFQERTFGVFADLAYPKIAIDPVRNASDQSEDDSHLNEVLRVDLFIAVTDADAPGVTKRLIKYCRALDAVLRTATRADYLANIDATKIMGFTAELTHDYLVIGKGSSGYARPARFELTLKFSEL